MAAVERTFSREVEVESTNVVLKIHQCEVGDVGCVVWDAGLVLAKYIDYLNIRDGKENSLFRGKNIIDLGSGTGLVGLVAASVGANVILTDLPELIPLLELNIEENKRQLLGSAKAQVLVWGELDSKFIQPDLLLVGDCIYYEKSLKPLVDTLLMLSDNNSEILLSYEDRSLENKNLLQTTFFDDIKELECKTEEACLEYTEKILARRYSHSFQQECQRGTPIRGPILKENHVLM